jgi:DNA-binding beta-propeller fold protein YncE
MGLLSGFVVPVDHAIAGHTAGNPPSFLFKWGSLCQLFDVLGGSGTLQGCVDPDGTGPLELGDGQFQQPGGLTLDSQGNVYVMDLGNHRIQKFDGKGSFLRKWGSFCDINDEFHRGMPTGCADADGDGPLQLGDGQFFLNFLGGAGIAIDSTDNVYVVDQGNNRIQVFDSNGTFLRKWGSKCPSRVEPCDGFLGPRGMAIDGGDFVYVYDGGRAFSDERQPIIDRVQKFDRNGTRVLKFQFCGPYTGNTCHGPNFITALNGWALAADSNDNVYVLRQFSSVAKFDSNGNRIGYFNPFTGFATPDAIAVDSLGQVYVRGIQSDSRVVRVVRDTGLLTPEFLFQFAQGSGAGDLQGDGGIALHPQSENVYLSDNTYLPNVTSPEIKVWGVTPLDGIESIIERVEDLVDLGELTQGQANALIVKLEAAIQQLQMDSSHVAVNQLQAFINHVNDLINTGVLPPSEGQPLIDAANHVIEVLNAGQ